MTGEQLLWMQIAARLGKTETEARENIPATEFVRWQAFFEREANLFHRDDAFLANIAYQVHLLRATVEKFIGGLKPEDLRACLDKVFPTFLIKFDEVDKKPEEEKPQEFGMCEAEEVRRVSRAKKIQMMGALGMQLPPDE